MNNQRGIKALFEKAGRLTAIRAVRAGLANMIPVLIIGAFALILKTFPVSVYQTFLAENSFGRLLYSLFDFVNSATFGVLSVYMTFSISRAYTKLSSNHNIVNFGAVFSSLLSFFIMAGSNLASFSAANMGPKSMFLAIIAGLGATALYLFFHKTFSNRRNILLSAGADRDFNRMITTIVPITLVALIFGVLNLVIVSVSGADSVRSLLADFFNWIFSFNGSGFIKGFLFVLLSSVLWFFGIHGSDTLEGVMQTYFASGSVEHLSKQFFDCFVLMGGCGSAICLLLAIVVISKNRARRGLGYAAAFPMLFNINELMVFGLPIILNPVMLIPFLTVPLVCYSVSYFAIFTGIVPMASGAVEWTTPIILGGYQATGSVAGSLLQLFNVAVGVLIYAPFVKMLDRQADAISEKTYLSFLDYFKENEKTLSGERLLELDNDYGDFAKALCADLRHNVKKSVVLAYQPQFSYDGECVGVEALMRWRHPIHGILYPPLIFKLAEEGGFLADLEQRVLEKALEDRPAVLERFGANVKLSVNVTGMTVTTPQFVQFCREFDSKIGFRGKNVCLEVTEQTALNLDDGALSSLKALKEMGLTLAIDDFSMGQTSLHYLKDELFDVIKLDGSLVTGITLHSSYKDIVASVTRLASSLQMAVIAEYVETRTQREILHSVGCDFYQGFLFSKAVFLDEAEKDRQS